MNPVDYNSHHWNLQSVNINYKVPTAPNVQTNSDNVYSVDKTIGNNQRIIETKPPTAPIFSEVENKKDRATVINTRMTKEALCKRAIALDASSAPAYIDLARLLNKGGSTTILEDGTTMTKTQLCKRAIYLDPNFALAYSTLGHLLLKGESTTLKNGVRMTREELLKKAMSLFIRSIDLDPNDAKAYIGLATIVPLEGVTLENGVRMITNELFKKAIDLDPSNANTYLFFGRHLVDSTFFNKTQIMTGIQLIKRAIDLDPSNSDAYCALGIRLSKGESITFENGTRMTRIQLIKRAIALTPNCSVLYSNLAAYVPAGKSTTLENGTRMTRIQLIKRAIALDPSNETNKISLRKIEASERAAALKAEAKCLIL